MPNRPSLRPLGTGWERGAGEVLFNGVRGMDRGVIRGEGLAGCSGSGSKMDAVSSKTSVSMSAISGEKSTASSVAYR